jgi:small subunit ribosomal protein S8e
MTQYQGRHAKLAKRKKKKSELGGDPRKPKLADKEERKKLRVSGGKDKIVSVKALYVNVSDGSKTKKVAITAVDENPANKDFKRENILSLGGLVDTELGKAKIVSRPSQDGVVNAVLVK